MRPLVPLLVPFLVYACGSFGDSTESGSSSSSSSGGSSGTSGTGASSGASGTSSSSGTSGGSDDSGTGSASFCGQHAGTICEDFEGVGYASAWTVRPTGKFMTATEAPDPLQKRAGKVAVNAKDWAADGAGQDFLGTTISDIQTQSIREVKLELLVRAQSLATTQRVDVGQIQTEKVAVRLYLEKQAGTSILVKTEQFGISEAATLGSNVVIGSFEEGDSVWAKLSLNVQLSDGNNPSQYNARVNLTGPASPITIANHPLDAPQDVDVNVGLTAVRVLPAALTYFVDDILVTTTKL